MDDEFQYKFELLKQEIDILHSGIRSYDGVLFTIKGWAITVFSAFIVFTVDKQKPIFLVFCFISIILFWIIDSIYVRIQKIFIINYNSIEKFIHSEEFSRAVAERSFKDFSIPNIPDAFDELRKERYIEILHKGFKIHHILIYGTMLIIVAVLTISFSKTLLL